VAAIVTTLRIDDYLENTKADLEGTLTRDGWTCTKVGFKYGLTETPTWDVNETDDVDQDGEFTLNISSLTCYKLYYYRAYADVKIYDTEAEEWVYDTIYGNWLSFTTNAEADVKMIIAISATKTGTNESIKFIGNLYDNADNNVSTRGFKYGLTETDTWSISEASGIEGTYDLTATGIAGEVDIYVRAYAVTPTGTYYSDEYVKTTTKVFKPKIFLLTYDWYDFAPYMLAYDENGNIYNAWELTGSYNYANCICVDADGNTYAIMNNSTLIKRTKNGAVAATKSVGVAYSIAINPDGVLVLRGRDSDMQYTQFRNTSDLNTTGSGTVLGWTSDPNAYTGLAIDGDGYCYVINRLTNKLEKWDLVEGEKTAEVSLSGVDVDDFNYLAIAGDLIYSNEYGEQGWTVPTSLGSSPTEWSPSRLSYVKSLGSISGNFLITGIDSVLGGYALQKYTGDKVFEWATIISVELDLYSITGVRSVAEVTTEDPTQVGVDHAKGNGTVTGSDDVTERGFEIKLDFSGTLREAINRYIAGFEGDISFGSGVWSGTLIKTVSETGSFDAGAYVDDLGRYPVAVVSDKLFAGETYNYRARATIEGDEYYGDWVEFTMSNYPSGEGPDDIVSPDVPIVEPIPPELPELPEFPEIVYPPWDEIDIDIPPFEFDPDIVFGKTFAAFLRGIDTKKDWITLREKCIIYQENMNEFVLTINHNSLVLKNLVIDVITYINGDVYPSDLELVESSQHLTPLYLEEISPSGFKDIINDFRLKDICNVHTLNLNFKKILNSLNSLYESDYVTEPMSYNTIEYTDIQPTAKRMILQLEDMRRKYMEVMRLTVRNMKRIFTYV